jgi:hypothetical protein
MEVTGVELFLVKSDDWFYEQEWRRPNNLQDPVSSLFHKSICHMPSESNKLFHIVDNQKKGTQCGLRDQISRQTKPKTLTALSMNKIAFFYGAETSALAQNYA